MLDWLELPLTRGLDLDAPETTALRRQIIREKRYLRQIYQEWYQALHAAIPTGSGPILELGSGAGFMEEHIPGVIRSDVLAHPGVSLVLDGCEIPFCDAALRAIVMVNVFHHAARPGALLSEAARVLDSGGVLAMVEPWTSPWASFVYRHFHHEGFEPDADNWDLTATGPLSAANLAVPWMVFVRDRERFDSDFPEFEIQSITLERPFSYLVSGGVSMRSLLPGIAYGPSRVLERALDPWIERLAMFAIIVMTKKSPPQNARRS